MSAPVAFSIARMFRPSRPMIASLQVIGGDLHGPHRGVADVLGGVSLDGQERDLATLLPSSVLSLLNHFLLDLGGFVPRFEPNFLEKMRSCIFAAHLGGVCKAVFEVFSGFLRLLDQRLSLACELFEASLLHLELLFATGQLREFVVERFLTLVGSGLSLFGIAEDLRGVLLHGFASFFDPSLGLDFNRPSGSLSLAPGRLDDGAGFGLGGRDGLGRGRRDEEPGSNTPDDGRAAGNRKILSFDRKHQGLRKHVTLRSETAI